MQKPVLHSITEVLPHLYTSGYGCLTDGKLKQYGITHAVDATKLNAMQRLKSVEIMEVPVEDNALAKLDKYFDSVNDFIEKAKAQVIIIRNLVKICHVGCRCGWPKTTGSGAKKNRQEVVTEKHKHYDTIDHH